MPKKVPAGDGLGFDHVPEIYDRVRPTYPPELFDELVSYLRGEGDLRAFEIGPGTGQATRPLLDRGIAVTAIDPGEALSGFLRNKLGGEFPQLEVVTTKFEDADLEPDSFDLVLAATSFHWLDPETRFQRCHDLLHDGGTLAVIHTNQIESTADQGFFARVQSVYVKHQQDKRDSLGISGLELPGEDVIPPEYDGLGASGLFDEIHLHHYRWDQTYTSAEYADLMRSYSGTQAMEPSQQEAMISDVCALVNAEFDGAITRPLVMTLSLGRRG